MVFINISIRFQIVTRIRIRNLELRIRIRQKVPDPCGSGSTTLYNSTVCYESTSTVVYYKANLVSKHFQ
jgi:hypothetical protein